MKVSSEKIIKKYFTSDLIETDPEVAAALTGEFHRQQKGIDLIASENFVSKACLDALSSTIVNKTVEGYPGKRYFGGAKYADVIEKIAIERAKKLFNCKYANVQPHSGSQANQAVYLALLKPNDKILSLDLLAGGHLSHGAKPNLTGRWMNVVNYGVDKETGLIDLASVKKLAFKHKPKLIICGGSSYPREIKFKEFREIADMIGCYLLADIAHFSGLVIGGDHKSPLDYAHITTTTTYKNLRGARGGLILSNNQELGSKIDKAVFPGIQGSSILNNIAAKAVCLGEALKPEFCIYTRQILKNARALAGSIKLHGLEVVTGSTDMPFVLVDLRKTSLTGEQASNILEAVGLICNKNIIPGDKESSTVTSGLRLGVAAGTTRGFCEDEFRKIGQMICDILCGANDNKLETNSLRQERLIFEVEKMCLEFPLYSHRSNFNTMEVGHIDEFVVKKYSVKVSGHLTSLSLEKLFWDSLNSIAENKNISINALVSEIDRHRAGNLSSAVRIYILKNLHQRFKN